jgi:CelD/BcsL family acetyltransferase involved in cellulose biosynthesis
MESIEAKQQSPPVRPSASRDLTWKKAGRDGGTYSIEEIRDPALLNQRQEEWQRLASCTTDPNPFYEPWFFLPAVEHLGENEQWRILLVSRTPEKKGGAAELCGFFPLIEKRLYGWLPQWSLWQNQFCFLTSPLVKKDHIADVWNAVLRYVQEVRPKVQMLEFPVIAGEGAIHHGLTMVLREHLSTTYVPDQYVRAITTCQGDVDAYFKNALGGHHVREYRRCRRKLEALGQLEYRQVSDSRNVGCWVDWFLDLEAQGWKARAGTAMKLHPRESEFFRTMVQRGFDEGRVRLEGLFLNGEPIALKCILLACPTAFAFKIAFDEKYHSFSPGVQLEFESLQHLVTIPGITSSDSCAVAGHQMIDRLWTERRLVRSLIVSTGHLTGDVVLGALPLLRSVKRNLRRRKTKESTQT